MALGVVRAVRDLGRAIPGDLSLVAHDDVFPWLRPENFPGAAVDDTLLDPSRRRPRRRAAGGAHVGAGGGRGEAWPVDLVVRGSVAGAPV
ncbi:hypothetical protein ACVOMV_08930 [Mesorhizobium atlanticum]